MSTPTSSPLSPPPPPTATRLNRRALAVAAALIATLGLLVAFSLRKEDKSAAGSPAEVAVHEPSEPAFLRREPRARIESPEEFFDDLHQREQAALELPDASSLGSVEPAILPPPPPAQAAPADLAREAFTRALRAPLRPDSAHQQVARPETSGSGQPLLPQLANFPRLPGLDGFTNVPGLTPPAPPAAPQAETDRFARFQGSAPPPSALGYQLVPAAPYRLQAGTVLPAALLSAIDSDLPGQILAVLTRDVYDSVAQRHLLIPRGARLLGRYDHQVAVGQDRLLVGWERLLLPDGTSLTFPALPAVDPQGRAGLSGHVDNHLWQVFGNALLLSVVSAGAQLSQPQVSADFGQAPSTRQVASAALGQELSSVAIEILRRAANVTPTIRIPAGTGFSVFLAGDLTLERPWDEGSLTQ